MKRLSFLSVPFLKLVLAAVGASTAFVLRSIRRDVATGRIVLAVLVFLTHLALCMAISPLSTILFLDCLVSEWFGLLDPSVRHGITKRCNDAIIAAM